MARAEGFCCIDQSKRDRVKTHNEETCGSRLPRTHTHTQASTRMEARWQITRGQQGVRGHGGGLLHMLDSDQFQNRSVNTGIIQILANVVKRVVTVAAHLMMRWNNLGCLLVNYLSVADVMGASMGA